MPLTLEHLRSKAIYKEFLGPLAFRIDFAWEVYCDDACEETLRKTALNFLIYAFDIPAARNASDLNQQLIELMKERMFYKDKNPEYIPGKAPTFSHFNPKTDVPTQTSFHGNSDNPIINEAIFKRELLDVDNRSKALDKNPGRNTFFLNPEQRAKHRVNIYNGSFQQHGKLFSTDNMISHDRKGYASFTINTNGEISVFNHHRLADRYAHSSMNAGAPVFSAGEIKIEKGCLKAINTHSGHYKPRLFHIYRTLQYFKEKGLDISETIVISKYPPEKAGIGATSKKVYDKASNEDRFETPASQFFTGMDRLMYESLKSIQKNIQEYSELNMLTIFFSLKDSFLKVFSSNPNLPNLSEKRKERINAFYEDVKDFRQRIKGVPYSLEKLVELEKIIEKHEAANNLLSKQYGKPLSDKSLHNTFTKMKEEIETLKKEIPEDKTWSQEEINGLKKFF